MSAFKPEESKNFKALYRKRYADIHISNNEKYTPEQFFDHAVAYFAWAEENHLKVADTASFQGVVSESKVHKHRVFTWDGIKLFCNISNSTIELYKKKDGYREVMEFIATVISEQKYQLAVNGIISSNIVSKELGIDKPTTISVSSTSNNGADVTTDEFKTALKDVLDNL